LNEQKRKFKTKVTLSNFFVKSLKNGKTLDDLTTEARIAEVAEELHPNTKNTSRYTRGCKIYASFRKYQIKKLINKR